MELSDVINKSLVAHESGLTLQFGGWF